VSGKKLVKIMSLMKNIMNSLLLSCKKASGLIEKKLHFPLNPIEKVQLFVHTNMCDACQKYQRESVEMDALLDTHITSESIPDSSSSDKLSDDFKSHLIRKIDKKE
jgi:hypothetical protein